jgi:hypothetical protein
MKKRRIGFLGFDGVVALDFTGPAEAFASALDEGNRLYDLVIIER